MEPRSPYQQLRQIGFVVRKLRPGADAERAVVKAFDNMQKQVQAAIAALRDYELAESEADGAAGVGSGHAARLRLLHRAVKSLEQLREAMLLASQYDLLGAADVAQLSAQLDELIDRLR